MVPIEKVLDLKLFRPFLLGLEGSKTKEVKI